MAWPTSPAWRVLVVVLALVGLAGPAYAQPDDPDVPPLSPPGVYRIIGQTDADSPGHCIGDLSRPICLVDLVVACEVRSVWALCAKALNQTPEPTKPRIQPPPRETRKYRVVEAFRLDPLSIPPYFSASNRLANPWLPGDVRIITEEIICQDGRCWPKPDQMLFDIRQIAPNHWRATDWYALWPDPVFEPIIQPGYDPDLPPLGPPGGWRIVGQTDEGSTENCAGTPRTPLCAIDSMRACWLRGNINLCNAVLIEPLDHEFSGRRFISAQRYRVLEAVRLDKSFYPAETSDADFEWKPGDIRIAIRTSDCDGIFCSPDMGGHMFYYLRKTADGDWRVILWEEPFQY